MPNLKNFDVKGEEQAFYLSIGEAKQNNLHLVKRVYS
jgi:hypothetical protein